MARINVYTTISEDDYGFEAPELTGWFDSAKAEGWDDRDYNGNGSGGTGRGQGIWRTAGGKWVLEHWSAWQGEASTYTYISGAEARDWLLRNKEDEAVEKYFGDIPEEEDRRVGRPEIGESINFRPGGELLAMVNDYAQRRDITRAEALRRLVTEAVTRARAAEAAPLSPRENY